MTASDSQISQISFRQDYGIDDQSAKFLHKNARAKNNFSKHQLKRVSKRLQSNKFNRNQLQQIKNIKNKLIVNKRKEKFQNAEFRKNSILESVRNRTNDNFFKRSPDNYQEKHKLLKLSNLRRISIEDPSLNRSSSGKFKIDTKNKCQKQVKYAKAQVKSVQRSLKHSFLVQQNKIHQCMQKQMCKLSSRFKSGLQTVDRTPGTNSIAKRSLSEQQIRIMIEKSQKNQIKKFNKKHNKFMLQKIKGSVYQAKKNKNEQIQLIRNSANVFLSNNISLNLTQPICNYSLKSTIKNPIQVMLHIKQHLVNIQKGSQQFSQLQKVRIFQKLLLR